MKQHLLLFLGGLAIWACITWPLPRHFDSAIPASDRNHSGDTRPLDLVPGDHLQLYYHFWLARDMLAGKTPLFNNLYEFNMGDGADKTRFDPYYAPFSWVFAATSPLLGDAAGWNLAGLASVLLGLYGCFCLARRYARSLWLALAVALIVCAFPYRWITLLSGSPTGFGIGLLPWLVVGLDAAVRDSRPAGGLVAGLALLGTYSTDLHCFYFAALLTPLWCIIAWCTEPQPFQVTPAHLRGTFLALLPTILLAAVAVGLSLLSSRQLAGTEMAGGRQWHELRLYSPIRSGLFRWQPLGASNHIFFGTSLTALIFVGYLLQFVAWRRRPKSMADTPDNALETRNHATGVARPCLMLAVATLLIGAVIMLALGVNGPWNGLPIRMARRLLPQYGMIRQTPKIFSLMPTLVTVLLAVQFAPLAPAGNKNRRRLAFTALFMLLGVATVTESALWHSVGLCGLPRAMPAYSAIARHAATHDNTAPAAVVIPLWPGDSHYASVYEYGITRSRVRLLNGYSPAVPAGYIERVVTPLYSLNQGVLEDGQLAMLKKMSVGYLIFHEAPYPKKVSLFPSAIALRRLIQHPRLDLLATDVGMWSFAIRGTPRSTEEITALWGPPRYLPAHQWIRTFEATDDGANRELTLNLRSPTPPAPSIRYLLRMSGDGTIVSRQSGATLQIPDEPAWLEAPLSLPHGDKWRITGGRLRLDHALITAGDGGGAMQDGGCRWHAADLFHEGSTEIADGSVLIDPRRIARGLVMHGPDLPFPAGRYQATLLTEPVEAADAGSPEGDVLAVTVESATRILGHTPVKAGQPAVCEFYYDGTRPLRLEYHYHRNIPIRLIAFELRPMQRPLSSPDLSAVQQ